jgi:hypothetical protein
VSTILVRDDDANATTDPAKLERAYAPLLDAGIPVNFAVVPEVALDTPGPDGAREGFISPDFPEGSGRVPLTAETPLATWLRLHSGLADVFVHGLSHSRRRGGAEFGSLTAMEAGDLLRQGLSTLERALDRRPVAFVAPWDAMSREALLSANALFDLVSIGWVGPGRLPVSAWPAHWLERLTRAQVLRLRRGWILRHGGCRIREGTPAEEVPSILRDLTGRASVAVVVLHHWQLWHGPQPHPAVLALARALRPHRTTTIWNLIRELDQAPRKASVQP